MTYRVMIKMAVKYWQDSHRTLYHGDCREMIELLDASVQMVCCSPPYWGLRKYAGLPDLVWDGDGSCQHQWMDFIPNPMAKSGKHGPASILTKTAIEQHSVRKEGNQGCCCSLCGAWKGQLGLEPTPELYLEHLIEIFREVRRVLRSDGIAFVNCGDSYYNDTRGGICPPSKSSIVKDNRYDAKIRVAGQSKAKQQLLTTCPVCLTDTYAKSCCGKDLTHLIDSPSKLKPKDMCLIPFRLAIALQDDGWWVRSVIIWNKPNPMPESVTDRPTESHEYILMLTKSARYYWDAEAVREPQLPQSKGRMMRNHLTDYDPGYPYQGPQNLHFGEKLSQEEAENLGGRNLRSVWTFPTQPYPEAHFATYPEKLVELCVKAATPEVGCCAKCGKPWVRILEKGLTAHNGKTNSKSDPRDKLNGATGRLALLRQAARERGGEYINGTQTLGWKPQCSCGLLQSENVGSIVLDPFAGSGTTLKVAAELNRHAIGYELSEQYCQLAVERNKQSCLL